MLASGITEFNAFIKKEAVKQDLLVVDLFSHSQQLIDPKYVARDGLHPSATAYVTWEELIYSQAYTLLKE